MTKQIEAIILALNRTLGSFCEQLQCSVEALRQSVLHRPIPPDSASSSFIKRLNHRLQMSSFLDEKSLSSWEDLHAAVEKLNSSLDPKENNYFLPDEISSLNLWSKTRSYLLLLVRINKLVVETINGMVAYRAL